MTQTNTAPRGLPRIIRRARIAKKLSQASLAKKCGVDQVRISSIELGKVPPNGLAPKLNEALGLHISERPAPKRRARRSRAPQGEAVRWAEVARSVALWNPQEREFAAAMIANLAGR